MPHFTDRELDVMAVLWRDGASTVAEVRDRLDDPLAYNTVLTVLRTLEDKGFVGHREQGKAYRYFAKTTQRAARHTALGRMVDKLFGGSAELLLTHLVSDAKLSPQDVERLRALIDEKLQGGRKP
jgi:predicted transcriptional regulator